MFLMFLLFSSNDVCKFISCKIMVSHDPNCGNIYVNCSNVCEVASGLLTREAGMIEQRFGFLKT